MGRKKGIKGMEEEGKWDGRGWRRMKMRGWKVQEKEGKGEEGKWMGRRGKRR